MTIKWMNGAFTAVGMRTSLNDKGVNVVNTCAHNDTDLIGDNKRWAWTNPTNRKYLVTHPNDPNTKAVSVECLWQGAKMMAGQTVPDTQALNGDWRRGKGKRPVGAWNGSNKPLITNPGEARRRIYIPAYVTQIHAHITNSEYVAEVVRASIYVAEMGLRTALRDHDTGRGVGRNGPLSHAWVLAVILNNNEPELGALDNETLEKIADIQAIASGIYAEGGG